MTIKILDEAENDIASGISFYENQRENLGNYFLDCIMSDIESLYIYAILDCRKNPTWIDHRLQ